ncbi:MULTISPECIES: hypothetical protein [Sphingomonadaceae]|uniref:hypothetical protein n=1 Tax=Sphingomonadaceae TaxID=41297 RepID=UPI0011594E09|nr:MULTISPECIES: hypothetical protein [Sphingomonadaceae]GFE77348.1 hypothetical protein NTCA1_49970 [Novosphingobium sp. TCA1]
MREDVTPTPLTPRDIMIEYALILRRVSGRIHGILREPETIQMPVTLRRSLTDCVKAFDECIADLETLASTAAATATPTITHTPMRVPTWRDGAKVALGVLIPCAAFVCLIALIASTMPIEPTDPEQIQRDAKWLQEHEDRFEAISRGGHGNK